MDTPAISKYDRLPHNGGMTSLPRFQGCTDDIEILELLGCDADNDFMPQGTHGYVFRVKIDSKPFALKIVWILASIAHLHERN